MTSQTGWRKWEGSQRRRLTISTHRHFKCPCKCQQAFQRRRLCVQQMEANKRREAELLRLRRDLEESSLQSEALAASLKKRHGEVTAELSEQCEALQRSRAKLEKDKQNLRMEVDDLAASLDSLQKAKVRKLEAARAPSCREEFLTDVFVLQMSSDAQMKKLEEQLSEATRRGDELQRTLTELSVAKNRLTGPHPVFSFLSLR